MRSELGAGCDRARQRREAYYVHITHTLRALINPLVAAGGPAAGAAPAAAASTANGQKGLSKVEREAYKAAILKVRYQGLKSCLGGGMEIGRGKYGQKRTSSQGNKGGMLRRFVTFWGGAMCVYYAHSS